MDGIEKQVGDMIGKAAAADKSDDAVKFAQAALNAAHAAQVLAEAKTRKN